LYVSLVDLDSKDVRFIFIERKNIFFELESISKMKNKLLNNFKAYLSIIYFSIYALLISLKEP
jgi:hypothetical protein